MAKKKSRRNAAGYTPAQQKQIDQWKAEGRTIPVGAFGMQETPEQLQARLAQANAAGAHATSKHKGSAGRVTRVGSRSRAVAAAVNDQG